ncbi:MAG: hypothetical protein M2R45_01561 [Verrucomicrobia subdivision 3 bacterium]|nr:hypothetical protein [Limisphaerales bacterium]MCS1413311.1 hypothetical protein [Limisphaerales bacterium]
MLDRLVRLERRFTCFLEHLIGGLLCLVLLIVAVLVALRYLFNSSIPGANEVITMLFVYTTAIGAAVGVGRWEHIRIMVVINRLPRRMKWLADLLGVFLVGLLNGVMCFYSLAWIGAIGHSLIPSTGLPRMAVQLSIPLGCGLAVLYCLWRVVRLVLSPPAALEEAGQSGAGSSAAE